MIWINILILMCLNHAIKSEKNFIGNTSVDKCNEFFVNKFPTLECQLNESHLQDTESSQPINLSCFRDRLKKLYCEYDISRNYANQTIKVLINHQSDEYQLVETHYNNTSGKYHFVINKCFNFSDLVRFRVSRNNSIGPTILQDIMFETDKIVKLPKVFPIKLNNLTSSKVTAIWNIPLINNIYEFIHFQYLNGNYLKDLNAVKMCKTKRRIIFQSDINLPYAYTTYTLTIKTFIKNVINWTEQHGCRIIEFQSKKRIPDSPPQTISGAFEYNANNNDVIIYWKETAAILKNGENFCIKLHKIRSNGLLINDLNVTLSDTWAKLHNLNPENVYDIKLIAKNSEGRSKTFSTIIIPKKENLLLPPRNLKILTNESLYHLSWISQGPTDNFTIFVCQPQAEQKSICQSFVDYIPIPGTSTSFIFNNTLTQPKIFAISSNLNGRSSGMQWFTCDSSTKTEMTLIDNATIFPINGTTVKLSWTLPCKISPFLKAINISYCEEELYKNKSCATLQYPMNLSPEVFIYTLTPYTNYTLELSMFDGNKTGPIRHMKFQTNWSMPETPTDLKYSNVTNNTVEIYWTAPSNWNGLPLYYNISSINEIESNFYRINVAQDFTFLTNLRSSTSYKIQVAACHKICSAFSHEIVVKTKIGTPEKITNFELDNTPIYEWSPPNIKNGDFQVYEIKFDGLINGKNETTNSFTLQTKCTLSKYFCSYRASIRAINLKEQINIDALTKTESVNCLEEININYTELYSTYDCVPGDWEIVTDGKCVQFHLVILIAFYLFAVLITFGVIFAAIQKCYKRFKLITDIRASIPTGLNLMFEHDHDKRNCNRNCRLSFDDEPQTIICEELQNELELRDLQEYKLVTCSPVSFNGDYVQIHQEIPTCRNMTESQL